MIQLFVIIALMFNTLSDEPLQITYKIKSRKNYDKIKISVTNKSYDTYGITYFKPIKRRNAIFNWEECDEVDLMNMPGCKYYVDDWSAAYKLQSGKKISYVVKYKVNGNCSYIFRAYNLNSNNSEHYKGIITLKNSENACRDTLFLITTLETAPN
jgi:hypothetical protein